MAMTNTLYDALLAPHIGNERVFLSLDGGKTLTYAQFLDLSARIAQRLLDLGVAQGDRVAVQVEKSPQALALVMACVQTGAVLLPLNTAYTPAELAYFIGDADPALILCDPAKQTAIAQIAEGRAIRSLDANGTGSLMDNLGAPMQGAATCGPDDLAAILYTSGTTGRSKGAMLSHQNLLSNAQTLRDLWQFTDQDRLIHALPIFHTHGLFVAVNICLLAGAEMIFMPKFDAARILDEIPLATSMMGVPTFYTRLLADPRLNKTRAQNMRLFVSGSAPLLAETHEAFSARTGHAILERYGMTETNMNTSNPYTGARRAGTVGLPLPGVEVIVADDSGAPLPQGQIGMVEVRGPNVFQGYWQMPDKTAAELRETGFFITGDLGQYDDQGYLSIVGRQKDLIISGGFNIYPKEVELLIDALPGVLESAVIGVPHPDFGEAVLAIVVLDAALTENQILNAIAPDLGRFKQPKAVKIVDGLPRNTMGKVQKNALRDAYKTLYTE
jgi:malonyl-CoA/methylmalonyl-CoA synthetase